VGEDSWGAAEAEAALARVKVLEDQALLAENKCKLAEEHRLPALHETPSFPVLDIKIDAWCILA